jgi:hypothetical protein
MMASGLVVARNMRSDTALFAELVKEELVKTSTNLMASNEDVTVMNGMTILKEMQSTIEDEKTQMKSLKGNVGSLVKGNGKWRDICKQVFHPQVLKPHLLLHAVTYIKQKIYTARLLVRVMDGLDHLHLVEPAYFHDESMMGSSTGMKKEHRAIEKEMMREKTLRSSMTT